MNSAGATSALEITTAGPGDIKVATSVAALRERAADALKQSVEIVRRRVDPDGVKNPQISQQPPDRILVELPGEKDLEGVKKRLNVVAKMDFHLVDETGTLDSTGHAPPGDRAGVLPRRGTAMIREKPLAPPLLNAEPLTPVRGLLPDWPASWYFLCASGELRKTPLERRALGRDPASRLNG